MSGRYANWSARERAPTDDETDLRELLIDGDAYQRREAALALVDLAEETDLSKATVDRLCHCVRSDDDADVRQFAVEVLGVANVDTVVVEDALSDTEAWVRAEAVVAFSRVGSDHDALQVLVTSDESGWVRRNALISLGKTGDASIDLLVECAEDDHAAVREYAAAYLGKADEHIGDAFDSLAKTLVSDPDAFVRARVASALGELGTDEAIERLETRGTNDPSEDVKRAAKRALSKARGRSGAGNDEPVDGLNSTTGTCSHAASNSGERR